MIKQYKRQEHDTETTSIEIQYAGISTINYHVVNEEYMAITDSY